MTTSVPIPTPTARAFLTGASRADAPREALGEVLNERGVADATLRGVRHLPGPALRAVDREIAAAADGLLDLDLGNAVISAWRTYAALTDAADRTLAVPGSSEVVALATHRVTSTYAPHVDLFVDDARVHSFAFVLTLVFDLTAVTAVVRSGALTALRGGECVLTGTLTLDGVQLTERQETLDLAWVLPLREPYPLVDQPARPRPLSQQPAGQEPEPTST